jgi:hypothetical protein
VTVAPSATSTSVTALVRYGASAVDACVSITVSFECRSAHTSTRACAAVRAAVASERKRRWTGASASISFLTTTSAPSANTAWLSATNGWSPARAMVPSIRSSTSGCSRIARAIGSTRTPSGSRSSRDSRSSKRPLTNTTSGHAACPKVNARSCSGSTSPVGPTVDTYPASAIAEVDV